jgi:dTMP kinase
MFIVFEGIDGCGKSTHARLLAKWLTESGRQVVKTAEPTKGRIGSLIREVLSGKEKAHPRTLALLFTADRAEHVEEIRAALAAGKIVVCERYVYSTVAYQSAQGLDRGWLMRLNDFAVKPDMVLFLDVNPGTGAGRTKTGEIFEKEEFLKKVRDEYLRFDDMTRIDSSRDVDKVQSDIRAIVSKRLP